MLMQVCVRATVTAGPVRTPGATLTRTEGPETTQHPGGLVLLVIRHCFNMDNIKS